jgi:tripartite-type tricarboxylate transporter receptor subunit TctC
MVMKLDRRSVLALSGCVLAAGLAPMARALAAAEVKSLALVEPLGKPSIVWTAFDLIRPALQKDLGGAVALRTIAGHDGFDAIRAVLASEAGAPALFGSAVMGTQYAEKVDEADIRIEALTPVVKLTNGFSVALFAKQGGPLKAWADLAATKPLKISSLERATAAYVAELMLARKGGIVAQVTLRNSIPEVMADVAAGRCEVGIIPTILLIKQRDRLQPIVTFGAARNAVLKETPTFAEVAGNRKLAFTESIGVLASPKLAPETAARLTRAFIAAGQDPQVVDRAEAAGLPLAVGGPDILLETMKRNERVLQRILG